jgi:hypothetical protein
MIIISPNTRLTIRHPDITRMVRLRPVQDGLLGPLFHHVLVSFLACIGRAQEADAQLPGYTER